jgi:hypothetical protein
MHEQLRAALDLADRHETGSQVGTDLRVARDRLRKLLDRPEGHEDFVAANETRTVLVEHDGLLELGPDARVVDRPEQARDIAFRGSALEIACGKPFTPPHRAGAESGGIALGELVQRPRIEPRVRIEHGLTEDLSSRALGKAGAPGLQIVAITAPKIRIRLGEPSECGIPLQETRADRMRAELL